MTNTDGHKFLEIAFTLHLKPNPSNPENIAFNNES